MYVKKKIEEDEKLIQAYRDVKYYCPHCRYLFMDIYNDHKPSEENQHYRYQCPNCTKYFNKMTYTYKEKNGKKYHFGNKKSQFSTQEHISAHIFNLWLEGYSNRAIHTITNFSRSKINSITKMYQNVDKREMSVEDLKKFLQIAKSDEKYNLLPRVDRRINNIRKAYKLGCSIPTLSKIFHMSRTDVILDKCRKYYIEDMEKPFEGASDMQEWEKQKRDFLKQCEQPIDENERSRKQIVSFNQATDTITIKGRLKGDVRNKHHLAPIKN